MVGTPMQFPQCAMPLTTPAKRERMLNEALGFCEGSDVTHFAE